MNSLREDDLITVLREDHRAVDRILEQLQERRDGLARRRGLVHDAIAALRRHAETEDSHLYPLVRRQLPDGDARADRELGEHTQIERVLTDLERTEAGDELFDTLAFELIALVRNHVQEEEHELFPRLTLIGPCSTQPFAGPEVS